MDKQSLDCLRDIQARDSEEHGEINVFEYKGAELVYVRNGDKFVWHYDIADRISVTIYPTGLFIVSEEGLSICSCAFSATDSFRQKSCKRNCLDIIKEEVKDEINGNIYPGFYMDRIWYKISPLSEIDMITSLLCVGSNSVDTDVYAQLEMLKNHLNYLGREFLVEG